MFRIVTVAPDTVHTVVVNEAKIQGRPEDAFALTIKGDVPRFH